MDSLQGHDESLYKALERANDMFLTAEERRRKENAAAFAKLHIKQPKPGSQHGKVVSFQ